MFWPPLPMRRVIGLLALSVSAMLIGVPNRPPIVKVREVTLESKTTLVAFITFVTLMPL